MHSLTIFLIFIGYGSIGISHAAFLKCYNKTMDNSQTTPLESPLPLMNNASCINKNLYTAMYIHGFTGNSTKDDSVEIITAYLSKGNSNVLLLDWAEEAGENNLGPILGYARAVSNVEKVGDQLGAALNTLESNGLDLNKVHLVGFSLGAHVAGIAGNVCTTDEGPKILRISGLDPAGPLFETPLASDRKLKKNSAKSVDAVHTDPGGYGTRNSVGTADFFVNYNPIKTLQPGCPLILTNTQDSGCSHVRSVAYFRESILNGTSFPGSGQTNYYEWIANNGSTDRVEYLGEYVSPNATGNFYLVTNAESPYGKGRDGLTPTPALSSI